MLYLHATVIHSFKSNEKHVSRNDRKCWYRIDANIDIGYCKTCKPGHWYWVLQYNLFIIVNNRGYNRSNCVYYTDYFIGNIKQQLTINARFIPAINLKQQKQTITGITISMIMGFITCKYCIKNNKCLVKLSAII